MRVGIFDLETSGLYANSSIILCACIKPFSYDQKVKTETTTIRADQFRSWKTGKSDNLHVVKAIMDELCGTEEKPGYDILVAHNGQYFDKAFLNSSCLKYGLTPQLRTMKFIDPVMIARKHMRIARNSLASLIDYFDIQDTKTPIKFDHWIKASHDSDKESLSYIVKHCQRDVIALERVYFLIRKLVKSIDDSGSAFR